MKFVVALPVLTLISTSCSPKTSCRAAKVYSPGGRFGTEKRPSVPSMAADLFRLHQGLGTRSVRLEAEVALIRNFFLARPVLRLGFTVNMNISS